MTQSAIKKWDKAAKGFDLFNGTAEVRYGPYKKELFSKCNGETMFVAVGTGLDLQFLPPGLSVTAVDFSRNMLNRAAQKAPAYGPGLRLLNADVQALPFKNETFDTIATSCTFCSVPDPVAGLKELHRVLKPGGKLLMFEHVRAGNFLLGLMMDIMTKVSRLLGPDLNRRTGDNIRKAGFRLEREFNVYLDMVKIFEARKD